MMAFRRWSVQLGCILFLGLCDSVGAIDPIKRLSLPCPASQMIVGGDGRYLVVSVQEAKQVYVIDLQDPSLDHHIATPSDRCVVAANRDHLLITDTLGSRAQRYQLSNQKPVGSRLLFPGQVYWTGMGASSAGPVWAYSGQYDQTVYLEKVTIHDPVTLRKVDYVQTERWTSERIQDPRGQMPFGQCVVSDDGTTFVGFDRCSMLQLRHRIPLVRQFETESGVPDFYGNVAMNTVPPFFVDDAPPSVPPTNIRLLRGRGSLLFALLDSTPDRSVVTAYDQTRYLKYKNLSEPIGRATLPGTTEFESIDHASAHSYLSNALPSMIEFLPNQELLVRLENNRTEVAVYPFQLKQGWRRDCRPDSRLHRSFWSTIENSKSEYQLPLPSERQNQLIDCKLIFGPPGMDVSEEGRISWDVPSEMRGKQCDALVHLKFEQGLTESHRILIQVGDATIHGRDPGIPVRLTSYGELAIEHVNGKSLDGADQLNVAEMTRLPSAAEKVCVAGNGNYLVLHMPDVGVLGIFDVRAAKMLGYLSVFVDDFVCSDEEIFLTNKSSKTGQRWKIPELVHIKSANFSQSSLYPTATAMGSGSDGKLFVAKRSDRETSVYFLSLPNLAENHHNHRSYINEAILQISAAANGEMVVGRSADSKQKRVIWWRSATWNSCTFESEFALPSDDGRYVITESSILKFTDDSQEPSKRMLDLPLVAATGGDYALQIPADHRIGHKEPLTRLNLISLESAEPVAYIDSLFEVTDPNDQSIWLLVQPGCIVQLDSTKTYLLRRRVRFPERTF